MNNNFAGGGALAFACLCVGLVLVVVLLIYIFFCLTLQRTMKEIRPRNRTMPPGLVWLHMLHLGGAIPILGIVIGLGASIWDLIMVLKIGSSLKNEFEYRNWRTDIEGFGRPVGLIWTGIALGGTPIGLAFNLIAPRLGNQSVMLAVALVLIALGLTAFVCWIIYWVQIAMYGRRLREERGSYGLSDIEEDYDDEFRGRSRDRYDDERGRDDRDEPFNFDRPKPRRRDDEYDDDDDRRRRRERDE